MPSDLNPLLVKGHVILRTSARRKTPEMAGIMQRHSPVHPAKLCTLFDAMQPNAAQA